MSEDTACPSAPFAPTVEDRAEMIAVAAYYLAERRGFVPGAETDDWLVAEAQIDAMLESVRRRGVSRRQFERAGLRNALRLWRGDRR